jgi:hypothetical protein
MVMNDDGDPALPACNTLACLVLSRRRMVRFAAEDLAGASFDRVGALASSLFVVMASKAISASAYYQSIELEKLTRRDDTGCQYLCKMEECESRRA